MLIATPGALTASLIGPKKPLFASGDGGSGENLLRTGFEQFWRCAFAPLHAAASSRTHAAQSVGLRHSSDANVAAANWASSTACSSLSLIAAFFISTNLEVRDGADTGLASVTASNKHTRGRPKRDPSPRGGEEEEEDLFVFNNFIEGPRAPAVKPGRVTQVLSQDEGCSPVSGGRTIRLCSFWPSDDPIPLRPSVDTGAGDRVRRSLRQVCSGGGDCRLSKEC